MRSRTRILLVLTCLTCLCALLILATMSLRALYSRTHPRTPGQISWPTHARTHAQLDAVDTRRAEHASLGNEGAPGVQEKDGSASASSTGGGRGGGRTSGHMPRPEQMVVDGALQRFQRALQFQTVSYDVGNISRAELGAFISFLTQGIQGTCPFFTALM